MFDGFERNKISENEFKTKGIKINTMFNSLHKKFSSLSPRSSAGSTGRLLLKPKLSNPYKNEKS